MTQSIRQRNLLSKNEIKELWSKKRVAKSLVKNCLYYNDDWYPRQILWHEYHDIPNIPFCKHESCNNIVKWNQDNEQDLEKGQYNIFCSPSCAGSASVSLQKRKKTCKNKYGEDSFFKTSEFQDKKNKTMLEKYGVKHALQNKDLIKKMTATTYNRFGFKFAMQDPNIRQKMVETNRIRYGVDNPMQSKEIKDKVTKQNLKKFGYNWFVETPEFDTKSKKSCLERYGNERLMNTQYFWDLRNKTMKDRYGSIHALQNDLLKFKANESLKSNGRIFESKFESEIKELLESLQIEFVQHDRNVLSGFEVDFFIPKKKLAIECNGVYWHSDKFKDKNYHYKKWMIAKDADIHLFQINEAEWLYAPNKIIAALKSCLGLADKGCPARKCYVWQIDATLAKPFLNQYHLQEFTAGSSHWGAFDQSNNLVGVMTFGWTRGSHSARRFELKRWVTDNQTHAGLFSKVFKHAQKELQFEQVVSFSMNDWFTGNVYKKCGFIKTRILQPSYWYYHNKKRIHCSNFTKANIKKKLPEHYNKNLTEREMMDNAGILRFWDSGKTEWIWNKK